jgi:hypothetical protein
MSVRQVRAVATALVAICVVASTGAIALLVLGAVRGVTDSDTVGGLVLGIAYPLLGGLLVWRQPRHPMGWIFLGIGLSQSLDTLASEYTYYGLIASPGSLPFVNEVAWLVPWLWAPGFGLFIVFSILLFPDGKLPTPRYRVVAAAGALGILLAMLPVAIASWTQRGRGLLDQPPAPGLGDPLSLAVLLQHLGVVLLAVAGMVSIAALLLRFRRAHGIERQQLKWFTYAGVFEISVILATTFVPLPEAAVVIAPLLVVPLLPIATAIAILRHRLFDIDLIIRRTLLYSALTVVLAAVYIAGVLVLQLVLEPLTHDDGVAVAASTLLVAALFRPARSRLQEAVNARFYRSGYDAQHVLASFAARVRDEVDIDSLARMLRGAADASVQPASVRVWLRQRVRR